SLAFFIFCEVIQRIWNRDVTGNRPIIGKGLKIFIVLERLNGRWRYLVHHIEHARLYISVSSIGIGIESKGNPVIFWLAVAIVIWVSFKIGLHVVVPVF